MALQGDGSGIVTLPLATATGDFSIVFTDIEVNSAGTIEVILGSGDGSSFFISIQNGPKLIVRFGGSNINGTPALTLGSTIKYELSRVGNTLSHYVDDVLVGTETNTATLDVRELFTFNNSFVYRGLLSGTLSMVGFAGGERLYNFNGSGTTLVDTISGENGTLSGFTTGGFTAITNENPVVNAGVNQNVNEGDTVTLDGSGSTDSDGTIASYAWSQTSGTTVTLSSTTAISPTFTAPSNGFERLTFSLTVTDDDGATSSADTVDIVVSEAVGYDVILLIGQSNMVGTSGPIDPVLDATDSRIFEYGSNNRIIEIASDPLDHLTTSTNNIGLGLTLAKQYADNHLSAGRRVLLVPAAQNSTGFGNGFWREGGTGRSNAIERANEAVALGSGSQLVMVAWHQGEADDAFTQTQYETDLDNLISAIRSTVTTATNIPFIVGEVPTTSENWAAGVANALIATPIRVANTAYVQTSDLPLVDTQHFTAASYRTIGARYETAYKSIVNNAPVLSSIATQNVAAGASVTVTASATDSDAGDTLTYSFTVVQPLGLTLSGTGNSRAFTAPIGSTASTVLIDVVANDGTEDSNTRRVTVNVAAETTPPVLTVSGQATTTIPFGGTAPTFTATATDNVDGNITPDIVVSGDTVNVNQAGTYVIRYNVSDAAGNAATEVTRTVIVQAEVSEPAPTVSIATIGSLTENDTGTATATTTNTNSVVWSATGAVSINASTGAYTVNSAGAWSITATATGAGGSASDTVSGTASAAVIESTASITITGTPNGSYDVDFTLPSTGALIERKQLTFANGVTSTTINVASGTAFRAHVFTSTHLFGNVGVTS